MVFVCSYFIVSWFNFKSKYRLLQKILYVLWLLQNTGYYKKLAKNLIFFLFLAYGNRVCIKYCVFIRHRSVNINLHFHTKFCIKHKKFCIKHTKLCMKCKYWWRLPYNEVVSQQFSPVRLPTLMKTKGLNRNPVYPDHFITNFTRIRAESSPCFTALMR